MPSLIGRMSGRIVVCCSAHPPDLHVFPKMKEDPEGGGEEGGGGGSTTGRSTYTYRTTGHRDKHSALSAGCPGYHEQQQRERSIFSFSYSAVVDCCRTNGGDGRRCGGDGGCGVDRCVLAFFKIVSSSLVKSYPAKRSFSLALRRFCEVGFVSIGKSIGKNLFGDGYSRDGGDASFLLTLDFVVTECTTYIVKEAD
jgi:hypothetical protein